MTITTEHRDRDGDLYPDHPDTTGGPCICVDQSGWGEEDPLGRPRPCLVHRPHLRGVIGPQRRFGARFVAGR